MEKRRVTSVQAALLDAMWEFGAQLDPDENWIPNPIAYALCQHFFGGTARAHQVLLGIPERFLKYDPRRRAFKVLRLPERGEVVMIRDESGRIIALELPENAFDKLQANLKAGVSPEELDTQHLLRWPEEITESQRLKKAPTSGETAPIEPPTPPPRPSRKKRPPSLQMAALEKEARKKRTARILRRLIFLHDRGMELIPLGVASSFCREVAPCVNTKKFLDQCVEQGLLTHLDGKWRVTIAGRDFRP